MHFIAVLFDPAIFGILCLFLSVLWMLRDTRDKTRSILVFALVLNLFYGFLLKVFMGQEGSLFPWKYDHILFLMDRSLGLPATSFAPSLQGLCRVPLWIIYELMVPMMIGWYLVTHYRNHRGSIILAYVAELIGGPVMYALLPACGPVYAFGTQWLHPPTPAAAVIRLNGIPNAFPSLHMATGFIFVLFAPGKSWRAVSLAFLVATCLATLSTGEHYVIDLIPGLAFGAFAASVGLGKSRRATFFLGVVCSWSLAVRFGSALLIAHPFLTRSCAVLTVLLAALMVYLEWRIPSSSAITSALEPTVTEPQIIASEN